MEQIIGLQSDVITPRSLQIFLYTLRVKEGREQDEPARMLC